MRTEEEYKRVEAERNAYQDQCIGLKIKLRLANEERDALILAAADHVTVRAEQLVRIQALERKVEANEQYEQALKDDFRNQIQALAARAHDLRRLLELLFGEYENGTPCYDAPEDGSFIGYAFHLDDGEFNQCVKILNDEDDTGAQILARRDAAVWDEAALVADDWADDVACQRYQCSCADELRAKAEQIAMYRSEMSAAVKAGFYSAQDLYTAYLGQAERIKVLESEKIGRDNTNAHQHAAELRLMEEVRKLKTEKDKADGVITSPWSEIEQGGRFERLCALPDALTAIEQYQKG